MFLCKLPVDAVSANFEEDVVEKLPSEVQCGIYCGWASVDNGPVYKMVMSVGFNPFYGNTKKTMVRNNQSESHCSSSGFFLLLLLVCVSLTIIGQPRNSVLIRRV